MPFAGRRSYSNASLGSQGTQGCYWSSSIHSSSSTYYATLLSLYSSSVSADSNNYRTYGYSVRCFKDTPTIPTSSWTTLYDGSGVAAWAWIFHNTTDWLISISSDWQNWITIMDKNLWATTVYNDGDTLSEANMGNMYQWWNNYWFPSTWNITNTSSTQVDASSYWPNTDNWYYSNDTFIIWMTDWSSVRNDDLWWAITWVVTLNNAITNTWVLSVNWQTWDVTVAWWIQNDTTWTTTTVTKIRAWTEQEYNALQTHSANIIYHIY
jgi:hypothetical protein